jgi:hypothetical protein
MVTATTERTLFSAVRLPRGRWAARRPVDVNDDQEHRCPGRDPNGRSDGSLQPWDVQGARATHTSRKESAIRHNARQKPAVAAEPLPIEPRAQFEKDQPRAMSSSSCAPSNIGRSSKPVPGPSRTLREYVSVIRGARGRDGIARQSPAQPVGSRDYTDVTEWRRKVGKKLRSTSRPRQRTGAEPRRRRGITDLIGSVDSDHQRHFDVGGADGPDTNAT